MATKTQCNQNYINEVLKIKEESREIKLHDFRLGNDFLDSTKNTTKAKIDNLDFIKIQNFCISKNTTKRVKRQTIKWGKAFINYLSNKELLEETHWKRPLYAGKD